VSIDIAGHTTGHPTGEWFADVAGEDPTTVPETLGFTPWTENESPFTEALTASGRGDADESAYEQVLAELRDEAFDEALEALVAETAEVVHERFADELGVPEHRAGLAAAHLSPVELEAEAYVDRLTEGLAGTDLASLSEVQLEQLLDSFDPEAGSGTTSPAGEEFIGGLVRKVKKVVGTVVSTAKKVGGVVGKALGGVLGGLRKLIRPLLRRVLSFAIGRLPAPLRPAARFLAGRLGFESESSAELEEELEEAGPGASPTVRTDPLALAESFDAALAETITGGEAAEAESFGATGEDELEEGHELERLAAARADLVAGFAAAGDGEDMAPAIEQFVPALLGALRIGLRLVGRPRVVGFLSKALAGLISRWVGPQVAGPLSSAIVDLGLRLLTLEAGEDEHGEHGEAEAAPVMLAATIEDAVRRFAEHEDFVFEDEGLMQLALAESFEAAVAATFPAQLVRAELQLAPSLGGSFVVRRTRTTAPYRKYSRVPQVELTPQQAEGVVVRRGTTLAAAMRAQGLPLPGTYRVHVFEAVPGTTLRQVAQRERSLARAAGRPWRLIHPLSHRAAAILLREPRLGVRVAPAFRRSHQRIAVGQRFFYLEPVGTTATATPAAVRAPAAAPGAGSPTQGWITVDLVRSRASVAIYLSEGEAQAVAAAVRDGRGAAALVRAAVTAYRAMEAGLVGGSGRLRVVRDASVPLLVPASPMGRLSPALRARVLRDLRRAALPALSRWARERGTELARAAGDPAQGVTLVVTVPGAAAVADVRRALTGAGGPDARAAGGPAVGAVVEVTVRPGMVRS
jgi:hypothetical protein